MAGRSPAPRRRRNRGWSTPSKSSRRPRYPSPSSAPPLTQMPPLPYGTEVEVRVDDDGFHGSWFEATVDGFLPARGSRSRARYTVTYSHLLSDDSGGTLVEPFAPTHIRPRPPPPSTAEPLRLHDFVEAFHNDGWWSGILLATDPLTAAFPITREVITFKDPNHVRPRREYVDGQWIPSQAAVSVKPKRAVKVYEVGDKVDVVRDREMYGYSWFPATVAKAVDELSYLVEYSDLEDEEGGGKAVEYLHCIFIRPDAEHTPRESEFRLGPGAAVEAYCDGAWSPGLVCKAIGEGEYEVSIDGKEGKLMVNKVAQLLKPQYKWDGKHWSIVSPKRQGNRRQSVSGKRPSSAVDAAANNDEHSNHAKSPATKRSRKELPPKKLEDLTEGSEHVFESDMDTTVSALRKSLASNYSPKSCSLCTRKNSFQVLSKRIVSSCAVPMKGLGLHDASEEHPTPQNESRADDIVEVVIQEIPLDMMQSDGQFSTPVGGTSADETHDMVLSAGLSKQKMDSSCVDNAVPEPQQSLLFLQPLQVEKCTVKRNGGGVHPIQALQGNSDTFDNIQLKGKDNSSCKEIICALTPLTASTFDTPSLLGKQMRAPDNSLFDEMSAPASIPSGSTSVRGNSNDVDRLSSLPDQLLHHMMSFLPMLDIVRTALLSPRWRDLWASTPFVHIDHQDFMSEDSERQMLNGDSEKLKEFGQRLLLLRDGDVSLDEARIPVIYPGSRESYVMIRHVIKHKVRFLHVYGFDFCRPWLDVASVFRSQHLKRIRLQSLLLTKDVFSTLNHGCSVLEHIELEDCSLLYIDDISSSSLKVLHMTDCSNTGVLLICARNLTHLSIHLSIHDPHGAIVTRDLSSLVTASVFLSLNEFHRSTNQIVDAHRLLFGRLLFGLSYATTLELHAPLHELELERGLQTWPMFNNLTRVVLGDWCTAANFYPLFRILQLSSKLKELTLKLKLVECSICKHSEISPLSPKAAWSGTGSYPSIERIQICCLKEDPRVDALVEALLPVTNPEATISIERC